ncbi:MAG: flavodoxin family protein [Eubacteriales bacterium]
MKTLILNGSPRDNGSTAFLVNELIKNLDGHVLALKTFDSDIQPCCDCRYCFTSPGCCVQDDMQLIYEYIEECDNIVLASPINFTELAGTLLVIASRLQALYANKRFLKINPIQKRKKGAIILCGGGDGGADKAESTAAILLKSMDTDIIAKIYSLKTDTLPAKEDQEAIHQVRELAVQLNKE